MINNLEVVYYNKPVPSLQTLTLLSFVYDKIYFPGIFIPKKGIDKKETLKELKRLISVGLKKNDEKIMYNCIVYTLNYEYIKDFCIFTGKFGYLGTLENGAEELAKELEELIYGKPPENFYPTFASGFAKGLPGDKEASVNAPSWLTYPSNALIYSLEHQIPLISDDPYLPIPGTGSMAHSTAKSNAKILSQILAIECIKLILPNLKLLKFEEIFNLREKTRDYIKPFRLEMLKLSEFLNEAIDSKMNNEEIIEEAKFIVDTKVYPKIEKLDKLIRNKSKSWFRRFIFNTGKLIPEISANFSSLPPEAAFIKALTKIGASLIGSVFDQLNSNRQLIKNGLYYLLKIRNL